jgi:hypothetical protein
VRNRKLVCLVLVLAVGTVAVGARAQAAPPTKAECSASHASSQELRLDGKLVEARGELRTCSDAACPSALQAECAGWLADVQQAIPSVEFLFETAPGERLKPKVVLDGQALAGVEQGGPFELNPGAHVFRFELEGHPAQEQTLVIRQGEKRRVLRVQFQEPMPVAPPVSSKPVPVAPPQAADGSSVSSRPIPIASYLFGGVALVAAGAGAYLGLDAISRHGEKEDTCAPNCPDRDVDELKTQLLLADIAGGVALVSAGVAVYSYLNRPVVTAEKPPSGSVPLSVLVAPNTVAVRLSGAF